jgi:hypothetical protein
VNTAPLITSMPEKTGFVGRTSDGSRVWLEIELRPVRRAGTTIEHETVEGYTELSICGHGKSKGRHVSDFAGQIVGELRKITEPAEGWTRAELHQIADVWERWHLNGMKAACAHMPTGADLGTYCQATDAEGERYDYKYGTAWLVEPLPAEVITQVRTWAARFDEGEED